MARSHRYGVAAVVALWVFMWLVKTQPDLMLKAALVTMLLVISALVYAIGVTVAKEWK